MDRLVVIVSRFEEIESIEGRRRPWVGLHCVTTFAKDLSFRGLSCQDWRIIAP